MFNNEDNTQSLILRSRAESLRLRSIFIYIAEVWILSSIVFIRQAQQA